MTHQVAVQVSLYWYYWWFDSMMHFWGGTLIGLGIHALSTLPHLRIKASTRLILLVLATATISWEVFEWYFGIWGTHNYIFDTSKDIALGFSGGLLAHFILRRRIQ